VNVIAYGYTGVATCRPCRPGLQLFLESQTSKEPKHALTNEGQWCEGVSTHKSWHKIAIRGLDGHVIPTEYRTSVHCIHMWHLFCNALVHVIYSAVSGQCSHTIQCASVLYSVVITWHNSNPPISQFNSPCNEFTSAAKQLSVCYYTPYSLTLLRICLVMRNQNTHTNMKHTINKVVE